MAPGPLTSSARGGFGYSFNRSQAFAPRTTSFSRASTAGTSYASARPFGASRDLGQRQRFAVGDSAEVVLGPEETLIVTVEDDPADAPPVDSTPTPDDATVTESYRRPRSRGLVVHGHPDGAVTVSSDDTDSEVVALGDPSTGVLELLEIPRREDR
jgi:hypothetical protein